MAKAQEGLEGLAVKWNVSVRARQVAVVGQPDRRQTGRARAGRVQAGEGELMAIFVTGNELPGDWEYDRKGGYVYCSFS